MQELTLYLEIAMVAVVWYADLSVLDIEDARRVKDVAPYGVCII